MGMSDCIGLCIGDSYPRRDPCTKRFPLTEVFLGCKRHDMYWDYRYKRWDCRCEQPVPANVWNGLYTKKAKGGLRCACNLRDVKCRIRSHRVLRKEGWKGVVCECCSGLGGHAYAPLHCIVCNKNGWWAFRGNRIFEYPGGRELDMGKDWYLFELWNKPEYQDAEPYYV